MSPIFEYHCNYCNREFERLELSGEEASAAQCPFCQGADIMKVISAPATVGEPWKIRMSPERLPNWHQQNKRAECHDAWMKYRQRNPLPQDRGAGIKVYETEGLKK